MELTLKKDQHEFYVPMALNPFYCETMRESIVPDSCADIARIVDTNAIVYLSTKEVTGDNRFAVSGIVDVSLLYIPEKGNGPCTLHFQLPFQCYGDGQEERAVISQRFVSRCKVLIPDFSIHERS